MNSSFTNYTPNDPNNAQVQQSLAATYSQSPNPTRGRGRGGSGSTASKRTKSAKTTASSIASPRTFAQDVPATARWEESTSSMLPPFTPTKDNEPAPGPSTSQTPDPLQSSPQSTPLSRQQTILVLPGANENGSNADNKLPRDAHGRGSIVPPGAVDEEADGEDDLLPAMADDDYSAQLSFQTQSKDNLKVLMDNFSPEQYDRYEAYRRNALPKQAVRRVLQQSLGQQISMPVAQIVAGFGKVFVGEIVEKARRVQQQRGESGPLAPDHLREAYRMYQEETGRVGAARPMRGKRMFMK